jgi:iron complex outermembrane receptor protein
MGGMMVNTSFIGMIRTLFPCTVILTGAFVSLAGTALAQERTTGALEEITVTARKIEESLQDTPVSVSAFTGDDLAVRSITSLDDVSHIAPNMSFFASAISGKNSGQAYIRGVGQFDYILSTDPGVGVYVDGVYLARSLGSILDLVDIERVEVLRGPQGTLYGKNTVGGAINVITRKPAEEMEGMIELKTGSYDRINVRANASMPVIKDVLAAKVAISTKNADGFGSRPLTGENPGNEDSKAAQGELQWTPAENLEVLVSMDYTWVDEQFSHHHTEAINLAAPLVGLHNALLPPYDLRYITSDPFTDLSTDRNFNEQRIWGVAGIINWDVWGLTVKSISSYRKMDVSFGTDPDGSPEIIIDEEDHNKQDQISQELQVSGLAFNDRLNWVAGLYYLSEDGHATFDVKVHSDLFPALEALPVLIGPAGPIGLCPPPPVVATLPVPGPLGCAGNPNNRGLDLDQVNTIDQETESFSVYGQGSYSFTDKLNGTYGIRYTDESKDFVSSSFIIRSGFFLLAPTPVSDSWSDVSHRIGLDFQWTPELMTYISAAKGFKSGGFNGRARAVNEVQPYQPEEMWSYEIGFKSEWLDHRLRANGAGFYNDYSDLQFTLSTVVNGLQSIVVGNAAAAEMLGFELEFQAVPMERLNLTASVGYLDSEYTKVDPGAAITTANKLIGAPKWTAAVGGEYSIPVENWGDIVLRADYNYRSKVYFDAVNTESTAQNGYGLINLRAAFESAGQRWSIAAGVTNATDKTYKTMGVGVLESLGFSSAIYGRPREWFLQGSYHF